jgi:hypothetical protein
VSRKEEIENLIRRTSFPSSDSSLAWPPLLRDAMETYRRSFVAMGAAHRYVSCAGRFRCSVALSMVRAMMDDGRRV